MVKCEEVREGQVLFKTQIQAPKGFKVAAEVFHLCEHPLGPMGPLGQRLHFFPVTPSLQLQRPLLSHVALVEPEGEAMGLNSSNSFSCSQHLGLFMLFHFSPVALQWQGVQLSRAPSW